MKSYLNFINENSFKLNFFLRKYHGFWQVIFYISSSSIAKWWWHLFYITNVYFFSHFPLPLSVHSVQHFASTNNCTVKLYKMVLALNNPWKLICCQTKKLKLKSDETNKNVPFVLFRSGFFSISFNLRSSSGEKFL